MDTPDLRILVEDRPLNETTLRPWMEHVDADAVWVCVEAEYEPDESMARDVVPVISFSATDIAAVVREQDGQPRCVLVVFGDLHRLAHAARLDFPPGRVVISHLESASGGRRLGLGATLTETDDGIIQGLAARDFAFVFQPLPNVTPRVIA